MLIDQFVAILDVSLEPSDKVSCIALRYVKAGEVAAVLEKVLGNKDTAIVADPRSNQLIVRATRSVLATIQEIISRLDVEVQSENKTTATDKK